MIRSLIKLLAIDIVGIIINVANAIQDIFKLVSMKEGEFHLLILIKCFLPHYFQCDTISPSKTTKDCIAIRAINPFIFHYE